MKWKYKNYMSVPGSCIIKSTNSSLRFFGIGKKFGWGLLPHVAHTLNATMRTLTSTDVVVLNLGVHWSQSCLKKFQHQNEEYAKELLSLQPLLDQDLDLCQDAHRDNMELTSTLQPRRYPLLIWKETSPQHFPTSNGLYPEGQRFHGAFERCCAVFHDGMLLCYSLCCYAAMVLCCYAAMLLYCYADMLLCCTVCYGSMRLCCCVCVVVIS